MLFKKQEKKLFQKMMNLDHFSGYRSAWHSPQFSGFCVPGNLVQRLLKDIDSEGTDSRRRLRLSK